MITFVAFAHMVDATKHMGLFTHFDCQKERFAIEKYKILSFPGPVNSPAGCPSEFRRIFR